MKRIFRLILSCCLGLLVPAVIFPWLVQALAPAKKPTSTSTFTPVPDSSGQVKRVPPVSSLKPISVIK